VNEGPDHVAIATEINRLVEQSARDAAKKMQERAAMVASAHTDEHIHEERYLNCGLRIAAKIRALPPEEGK
jgi:hypothetical protein